MVVADSPYRRQSYIYWEQALEELAKGDLRQASGKGWRAASQMVKAVGDHYKLPHSGHSALNVVVSRLNDAQLINDFGLAQTLHQNFYEGWLDQKQVQQYLDAVGVFIKALDYTDFAIDA